MPSWSTFCCRRSKLTYVIRTRVPEAQNSFLTRFCSFCASLVAVPSGPHPSSIGCLALSESKGREQGGWKPVAITRKGLGARSSNAAATTMHTRLARDEDTLLVINHHRRSHFIVGALLRSRSRVLRPLAAHGLWSAASPQVSP